MSFESTPLPRSRENNRAAPSLYEYNLLVQKVNALKRDVKNLQQQAAISFAYPTPASAGQVLTMQASGIPKWATGSVDNSLFVFGYSISGAIVTVSKGYCQHATRGTLTKAAAPVTITTDHQFAVLNYVMGSGLLTVSLSVSYPLPDATTWRKPLHQWRLISGVASLEMFFPGNLEIPGIYS